MSTTETIALASAEGPGRLCCPVKVIAPDEEGIAGAAAVFKALADPTRLRILKTISHMQALCECSLVPEFGLSQPTISYHLKVLREAGLITSQRRGQWVWHQVNEKTVLNAVRRLSEVAG
jgi:ArsR family transcriptional regulator